MIRLGALLLALSTTVAAQPETDAPRDRKPEGKGQTTEVPAPKPSTAPADEAKKPRKVVIRRAGPALLSVERKTVGATSTGVYLRDEKGKTRRLWAGEPYDAHAVPDGTTLIVERWKGRVHRLDPFGKVTFTKAGLDHPVDVEQAKDGTVVVVLNVKGHVVGLDPKTGKVRWTRRGFTTPFDVAPLPDGGLWVADSGAGRVVRLDKTGKVTLTKTGLGFPNTIEALKNGHALVTTWSSGEVLELNAKGKIVWRVRLPITVYRAVRRQNGTTLVVEGERGKIHHVDAKGRVVKVETFRPGCVDFEPLPGI